MQKGVAYFMFTCQVTSTLVILALGKWRAAPVRAPMAPRHRTEVGFGPAAGHDPGRGLRLPVHVLRLLLRLEKSGTPALLWRAGARNVLGCMEAQLDEFPLDLRPCRVPRSHLRCLPVPAESDARHFPARVGVGCGALFDLPDNRLAAAEPVDARQRCAQPLLGDARL